MVEHDLDALTSFVNEQIDFHSQVLRQAQDSGDDRRAVRHITLVTRYRQLADVLADCKSRSPKNTQRLALAWEEVNDLPPELLAELSVSDGDKLEFDIVQVLEDLGGVASLDRLLVSLYRRTGEVHQRTWLNNRLYRMVQKELVHSVPGKKGVYSLELMTKEDAAALL